MELMKVDRSRKALVRRRINKKHGLDTPNKKDVTAVLRKKVAFCSKDNITLRPEQRNALSNAVSTSRTMKYNRTFYENMKEVMAFRDSGNIWMENSDGNSAYFVGFIKLSSDETATTLNSTG